MIYKYVIHKSLIVRYIELMPIRYINLLDLIVNPSFISVILIDFKYNHSIAKMQLSMNLIGLGIACLTGSISAALSGRFLVEITRLIC
jgi:hypothetical protein